MIGSAQRQHPVAWARATPLVRDTFEMSCPAGTVVGSTTVDGQRRGGADRGGAMSVDGDGLRIRSLSEPGWGAATLSYGPFPLDDVAFAVLVLNGHNTAQHEPLGEPLRRRITRWMRGPETEPWPAHVWSWALHGPKRWTLRRFHHWWRLHRQEQRGTLERLDENFSVGFVPGPVSTDPLREGHSFVMHATGAENGELWVRCAAGRRRVLRGVHNVPLYLLTAVSGDSVVHYAASLPAVHGLAALPWVRPVAVEPRDPSLTVAHAALQQAVSGQIGFAADTRVWAAAVARVDGGAAAFGRPALAVALDDPASAEGPWTAEEPAGLVRVRADAGSTFTLDWRTTLAGTGWRVSVEPAGMRLICRSVDGDHEVFRDELGVGREPLDVQVVDDGATIGVYVNGRLACDRWIADTRFADGCGVAVDFGARRGGRRLEVHPRAVLPPEALSFPAPHLPRAIHLAIDDDFTGPDTDLDGRQAGRSGLHWRRSHSRGRITTTGAGAHVVATPTAPLPGRTVYTLPWSSPGAVELEILVDPPGTGRGEGHRGRAGVVFQQDEGNALIVATWLDDVYAGASISSFFRWRGFEDLYDAVWTNVGARVQWGRPYRLRAAFDGHVYATWLDDELVLYRRLDDVHPGQAPLHVRRVGIVANWEWGTDTGSTFRRFTARSASAASTTTIHENGRTA